MKRKMILPGSTIGVLGGGQLGRMMALAGRQMGYRFATLEPGEDSPCGQVADRQITAAYSDLEAARELARISDVITYEFENVDAAAADVLMKEAYVPQGSRLLYTTQHRLREKRALEAAGVQVAPYAEITSVESLREAVREFGLPCVLKTATGGYDGKGQWVIRSEQEIEPAFRQLRYSAGAPAEERELVLEQFIPFKQEISAIAARSTQGEIAIFPVAENIHVNNILHLSIVPARIDAQVRAQAERIAHTIAERLDVFGLIAVEMFVTEDGSIYVNELAPRPHNSGHYTMEACRTSQFEQHVRAICGLPLGPVTLSSPVVMVNILGQHLEQVIAMFADKSAAETAERHGVTVKLHLYGKKEAKHGRKMGHLNVLAESTEQALRWIEATGVWSKEMSGCSIES